MLDLVVNPAYITILIPIAMAFTLLFCLCGCKAKERKDELVGIEGHVKMHNLDAPETEVNANNIAAVECERVAAGTAQRSLPDLPVDNAHPSGDSMPDPSADGVSDLYATVGTKTVKAQMEGTKAEHPYDKLRTAEHPYAQVVPGGEAALEIEPIAGTSSDIYAAPHQHQPVEIAAAPAIAGHVHASDDLPYMTPPPHFSGDSTDSAKGYTSISVREPLASIRAETAAEHRVERLYAAVSDDSDDMYAAIDEPASGSETYAKILGKDALPEAPPPPSVDTLRSVTAAPSHSRQESSSSAASSSAVSSPKPEKREANSPLPAPPAAGTLEEAMPRNLDDMYAKVNKKKRKELIEPTFERGPSTESAISGSSESVSYRLQNNISSLSTTTDSSQSHSCHSHPDTSSRSSQSCPSHATTDSPSANRQDATDSSLSSDGEAQGNYERLDPQYETLARHKPDYETLKLDYDALSDDPKYETLGRRLYESLPNGDPAYETLGKRSSEPNYETLGKGPPSDSDPNYERIRDRNTTDTDGYATVVKPMDPPYTTVTSRLEIAEPPYSSLGPPTEPNYETVRHDPPYQLLANCESGPALKQI